MKKETYYCDRCGKKIIGLRNNRGFRLHKFHIESIHEDNDYMDLCQGCYNSLADWIKKGGKEKESEDEQ